METLRSPIEDIRIKSITPIKSPIELKTEIPNLSTDLITKTRQEIQGILHGQDPKRLLIIAGPCSIHDPEIAVEYAQRLNSLTSQLENELVIVMRAYFEKPRSTIGWTGLVSNPLLDGSSDVSTGLTIARRLLADINNSGLPCATEFLDTNNPQYYADLVSWGVIGARTIESQVHRQLASGLSMPIGFKNSTEGNIKVAAEAMVTASSGHRFPGINQDGRPAEVETTGNPDTHIVLRGGIKSTNYDKESIVYAVQLIREQGLLTESSRPIMVDCSHQNSRKDHRQQPTVFENVLLQVQSGQHRIMGIMIESNLEEGRQDWVAGKQLQRGVSITDACISWEQTKKLLLDCARVIHPKRYLASSPKEAATLPVDNLTQAL